MATGAGEAQVSYQVCKTCGFRLMRVVPAYSRAGLLTLSCPICGYSQDEQGIHAGQRLTASEKKQAWKSWLSRQGLTCEYVERHYHLIFDDFFLPQNGR